MLNNKIVVYIIFLSMLAPFATECYLPSLPFMAKYFAVPINDVQYSIAIFAFGSCIGAFVCGGLSDLWGRRLIVIITLLVGVIGSFICLRATTLSVLLFGRFIQGFGFAGASVIGRSITRDISNDRLSMAKFASIIGITVYASIACAPIIGGYIQHYSEWQMNFMLLFIVSLILLISVIHQLPETRQMVANNNTQPATAVSSWHKLFADYLSVLQNQKFLKYTTIGMISLAGMISYQTVSSYLLQICVGLSPKEFGYCSSTAIILLVLGAIINRKFVEYHGVDAMIAFASWLYLGAGLFYIITGILHLINLWIILLPAMVFMVATSIIFPNASAASISLFADKIGAASSIYNSLQLIGAAISSSILSLFIAANQWFIGVFFTLFGLIILLLVRPIKVTAISA